MNTVAPKNRNGGSQRKYYSVPSAAQYRPSGPGDSEEISSLVRRSAGRLPESEVVLNFIVRY